MENGQDLAESRADAADLGGSRPSPQAQATRAQNRVQAPVPGACKPHDVTVFGDRKTGRVKRVDWTPDICALAVSSDLVVRPLESKELGLPRVDCEKSAMGCVST